MPPKGTQAKRAPILGNDSADELESVIRECWKDGLKDVEAVVICQGHYDTNKYHLSTTSYRRLREKLELIGPCKQDWTVERANEVLQQARARHPQAGIQEMINIVRVESDGEIRLTRSLIEDWMKAYEPEQVQLRKRRLVKRRQYYCAGVNHIWAIDQHDKWKRFGLWLHVGLDVYSGRILWMKVYWTNSNPRLICKYYLDAIQDPEVGGMPLVTFSDPGSENYGVANAQSTLRQMLDPSLSGTMQHKWMRRHSNIKPEILWSQFRARAAPQLESLMQEGIDQEWYNPHNNIEMLVFRWVWMPLIQAEIDNFVNRYNTYHKRANKKTLLPNGKPKYIFRYPKQFGADNYRVLVPTGALEEVRARYANPTDPVFTWIPPNFEYHALHFYRQAGSIPVVRENAWACYHYMLGQFRALVGNAQLLPELTVQGELQANLLVQSESGSHRGDEWGYDLNLNQQEGQEPYQLGNGLIGEVVFEGSENDNPEVDFSGDELDEGDIFD